MWRVFILFCLLGAISCGKYDKDVMKIEDAADYLVRFGYLVNEWMVRMQNNPPRRRNESLLVIALKQWQEYNIVPVTGELDDITKQKMNDNRCANKDKVETLKDLRELELYHRRKKRAMLQGSKWSVSNLTWKVSRFPPGLPAPGVLADIVKALKLWQAVTPLNFIYSPQLSLRDVHIDMRFDSGCHGDGQCHDFDGQIINGRFGNTLAHAFYPQWGGDVHFDEDEEWSVNSYIGCNVFIVAAHEIGHALGLNHSSVPGSMMQPVYPPYRPNHDLHDDDVIGIQTLYGARKKSEMEAPTDAKQQTEPIIDLEARLNLLCQDPSIDDIGVIGDSVSVFKGKFYYNLLREGNGIQKGFPKYISQDFFGVDGSVDAVLTATRSRNYIFQGDKFWKFAGTDLLVGYPKKISDEFKGIPSKIDTAFQMESKGKVSTFIFKGEDVWKFSDPDNYSPVQPQKISTLFKSLPASGIDAIFQAPNKMIYAFKKSLYWRLSDDLTKSPANPDYPRETALWYFGCRVNI